MGVWHCDIAPHTQDELKRSWARAVADAASARVTGEKAALRSAPDLVDPLTRPSAQVEGAEANGDE